MYLCTTKSEKVYLLALVIFNVGSRNVLQNKTFKSAILNIVDSESVKRLLDN